jgi:signal peptidase I
MRRSIPAMHLKPVARHLWREWLRPLALPILLIIAAKSALADINYVPSGSMQPTILPGDVVFINKLAYDLRVPFTTTRLARWSDPARGDIVICFAPDDSTRLVKRVAALPGDTVELREDMLYLNGTRQSYAPLAADAPGVRDLEPAERNASIFAHESFVTDASSPPYLPRIHATQFLPRQPAPRNFGPVTVPAGHYFMLGDNRDNSRDSRYFGFMPRAEIIGEAKAVVASADLSHWLRPRFHRFFSKLD